MDPTGAELLVQGLVEQGISTVFGHPGGAVLPLYDALAGSQLRHVLVRHEQNAAHMADGWARVRGTPGVCIATSGPGATNLATGLATAYMDSSPVVAVTGQVATSVLGTDAFQEVDALGMFMPFVKHNWRLERAADVADTMREAFALAAHGRYGPVHLDVPLDVQRDHAPAPASRPAKRPPAPSDLRRLPEALDLLTNAAAPILLVGGGARWSQAGPRILELAERLGAGVATTLMGKGVVPEDHPLVLGPVGMHGRLAATTALQQADVVVALGSRLSDRSLGQPLDRARDQRIVHVDVDASEFGKRLPDVVALRADVRTAVDSLLTGLTVRRREPSAWRERVEAMRRACACAYDVAGTPLKPQRVVAELNRLLPEDAILTTEVGRHQMWAEHFFEVRARRRFITSGGLGTMGFGFPAALGAKLAAPDRPVLDLAGDGSFQMTLKELATARENGIAVSVLVLKDGSLGMVEQWQRMFYGQRYSGVDLGRFPDFAKLAQAYGCEGLRVERTSELRVALAQAARTDVPLVIDVAIDGKEDVLPMVPPGRPVSEAVLGQRCVWKGGEWPARPVVARA